MIGAGALSFQVWLDSLGAARKGHRRARAMRTMKRLAMGFVTSLFLAQAGIAQAAEIKVLSAEALRSVFDDLARDFERTSGHKVVAEYATGGVAANRIRGGEHGDVIILPMSLFAPLANEKRIV